MNSRPNSLSCRLVALARLPRASRPPLCSLLCSIVNRLIAHASLRRRFMIERQLLHTSTRGSVAPRQTSNRRFIGDCIHPALLGRGIRLRQRRQVARRAKRGALRSKVARGRATEPPDSHSLPYTRSTCSTRLKPSAHSASLRTLRQNPIAKQPLSPTTVHWQSANLTNTPPHL